MIEIKDLKLNDNNPRFIRDDRFAKLKDSIEQFPKMMALRPIVVDQNGIVLGGNMRLRALIDLGYKSIPKAWVKKADELNEEEKRRFIIADNTGFGEWDWDLLANEWDAAELETWGLETPDEWGAEEPEAQEDGYEMPDEIETDVKEGDLIEIGPHRLLCGDSTKAEDVERLLGDAKPKLMVTDPPYGVSYVGGTADALTIQNDSMTEEQTHDLWRLSFSLFFDHLTPGASIYATVPPGPLHLGFAQVMKDRDALRQIMVWNKDSLVLGRSDYHYKHEPILYGWKPGASHFFINDRTKTSVLDFARPKASREHPTMKPLELWSELIVNSSKKNWLCCDPFLGSGTTMVAAHQLNRICYGMEIDPKYCQVIIDRMHKLDPDLEIKINGEKYEPKVKEVT